MSASSIARWNATPQFRPGHRENEQSDLKPASNDNEDVHMNGRADSCGYGSDESSILSRSPSPPLPDEQGNLSKYDEYVRGTTHEVITVETKIKSTNKGFAMLTKLGWSEGQPVGLSSDGRIDPIPFHIKRDMTGLGKTTQDVHMIETTVSQRRGLDSERQQNETEEQRRAREDSVARRAALETQISDTLRAFYCTLCEKQFRTVAQYDEHTNSYAHHHKARFREMQASQRIKPKEEVDKRKEKERKREEKELRKIAAAAGVKLARPAGQQSPASFNPAVESAVTTPSDTPVPKKSGWTTLSSPSETLTTPAVKSTSSFRKSGWATLSSTTPSEAQVPALPEASGSSTTSSHGHQSSAPSFRTAGWTSLDTNASSSLFPPPLLPSAPAPPPPSAHVPPPPPTPAPPPPPCSPPPAPSTVAPPPPPPPHSPSEPVPSQRRSSKNQSSATSRPPSSEYRGGPPQVPVPANSSIRSNWQQFKQGGPRRR